MARTTGITSRLTLQQAAVGLMRNPVRRTGSSLRLAWVSALPQLRRPAPRAPSSTGSGSHPRARVPGTAPSARGTARSGCCHPRSPRRAKSAPAGCGWPRSRCPRRRARPQAPCAETRRGVRRIAHRKLNTDPARGHLLRVKPVPFVRQCEEIRMRPDRLRAAQHQEAVGLSAIMEDPSSASSAAPGRGRSGHCGRRSDPAWRRGDRG